MKWLQRVARFVAACFKSIVAFIRLIGRWKGTDSRPRLVLEYSGTASWGVCQLPITIRNTGTAAARDCRYCRFRSFSMLSSHRPAHVLSADLWYATDSFSLPAQGCNDRLVASATHEEWPRAVLADLVQGKPVHDQSVDIIVCRDWSGTKYRFRVDSDGESSAETWRDSPFDRFLRRRRPAWTEWTEYPARVTRSQWDYGFA